MSPFPLMRRATVFAICAVATSASATFAGPKDSPNSDAECSRVHPALKQEQVSR